MAWMISKAENLLNSLDQSATNVLTQTPTQDRNGFANGRAVLHQNDMAVSGFSPPAPAFTSSMPTSASAHNLTPTDLASTSTAGLRRTPSESALSSSAAATGQKSRSNGGVGSGSSSKLRTAQDDEKLFEFLNKPSGGGGGGGSGVNGGRSSSPLAGERRREKRTSAGLAGTAGPTAAAAAVAATGRHSRQSSTSSTVSSKSVRNDTASNDRTPSPSSEQTGLVPSEDQTDGSQPPMVNNVSDSDPCMEPEEPPQMHSFSAPPEPPAGPDTHSQQLSSLELENKLLKNEVGSLNQEMASALGRARKAQEELHQVKAEMQRRQRQMSSSDTVIRQLQAREEDLTEELGAKNSQLAVLRVRLQEADGELKAKVAELDGVRAERNRILRDHSDASGVHSNALDSVKDRLTETETLLKREQDSYKTAQVEFMGRQGQLETEKQNLAETLTASQKKYHDERSNSHQLAQQLKMARSQLETAKEDLADYKKKATRILQSKDKLIAGLKDGGGSGTGPNEGTITSAVELEELRSERDGLKEELQMSNGRLQELRTEFQELEMLQQTETDTAQDQVRDLEEQLVGCQHQLRDAEADLRQRSEELRYAEAEAHKTRMSLQTRLQDREEEIQKLRNQLMSRSASSTSQTELESRLHALTESLIQKQTMLEALSTEKNSLVMQLERMERQYKEVQLHANSRESHTIPMRSSDDDDGTRPRSLPSFLRETPLDAVVTKNVKRAANTIDKFSIRLGVFLRRYPIARLFVIAYMILLHLWVMVVLLTYSPEIHGSDFHPQGPK